MFHKSAQKAALKRLADFRSVDVLDQQIEQFPDLHASQFIENVILPGTLNAPGEQAGLFFQYPQRMLQHLRVSVQQRFQVLPRPFSQVRQSDLSGTA